MISARSSQRSGLGRRGGVACGGSGPQPLPGVNVTGRQIPIASPYAEILVAGCVYGHLQAPQFSVPSGLGRNIPDTIAEPDILGNLRERFDDLGFLLRPIDFATRNLRQPFEQPRLANVRA